MKKSKLIVSLILNIMIFGFGIPGMLGNMKSHGIPVTFYYYTQDSNIFLFLSTIPFIIWAITALVKGKGKDVFTIPKAVFVFRFFATITTTVTFIVVIFILAPHPLSGGFVHMMTGRSMLYQHTICPVLAIISFLLFENNSEKLAFRYTLYSLIPTLIYAAFLYPMNITGSFYGPYPFLLVNEMGLWKSIGWFFIVVAIVYGITLALWAVNRKFSSKKAEKAGL